jgi:hypothetical protein
MSGDEATKWNGYSVDEFREIFTDTKRIEKILTVPELKMYVIVNLSWLCIPLWDNKILSIFG